MAKVKVRLLRKPGAAGNDGNPYPKVGTVFEVSEDKARALVNFHYAERVEGEDEKPEAEKPEDKRETAEDADAAQRETREDKTDEPVKRGPGRPRKSDK